MRWPTSADPVKDTAAVRGSVVRHAPTSASPVTSCTAAPGHPASRSSETRTSVVSGVAGAGLTMTGQPAPSAGATLCAASRSG